MRRGAGGYLQSGGPRENRKMKRNGYCAWRDAPESLETAAATMGPAREQWLQ